MYFAIHQVSDKGNRKTKKLIMFLEFNKIEIASCFVISKVHFNYEVLVKKYLGLKIKEQRVRIYCSTLYYN